MKTLIAVLLLNASLPLAAGSPAAADPDLPAVGRAGPAGGLARVDPARLDSFLDHFKVSSVYVQGDNKGLQNDPAVRGILDQVLAHHSQPPEQQGGGAPPRDPYANRTDAEVRPDLASVLPHGPQQAGYQHLIFYDTGDDHFQGAWARQAGLLQGQLRALGVPADNISITPLSSREDFFCALSASEGPRQVYFFGHGSPLVMHIGTEQVNVGADARALQEQQVRLIAHYGCSFVNVDQGDLGTLQGNMQPGTSITLVGHRDLSDPFDDRWWDRDNPLMRVTVTPNTSTMYSVHDELRNRVAPALGLLLGAPAAGPLPSAAGAAAVWQGAEYYGPAPTTIETDIARQAAALIGNAAGGPLPALVPPYDPRFGARFVPKYRSGGR